MGVTTHIEWASATWNPWHGCLKVSPGCKRCYMYREKAQYGQRPDLVVRSKTTFRDPLKWREPQRVFTCSWSDFFIAEADAWRADAWEIIRATPQHTYLVLTKRTERVLACLPADWGDGYENVWMGFSAENQAWFERRLADMRQVATRVRWCSAEPLLERLFLDGALDLFAVRRPWPLLDWVVVGGESGPGARPFDLRWAVSLIEQCRSAGVPVFVKQIGSNPVIGDTRFRVKDPKGSDPAEWPENLRVRQFPEVCA